MSRELFYYKNNELHFGLNQTNLASIVADYQNPTWVYDLNLIRERLKLMQSWKKLTKLFYAMKANFHPEILKTIQRMQAGVDVVSLGEIRQAIACGFKPNDIIFSGVGKSEKELRWAIENEIYQINTESISEIEKIKKISTELKKEVHIGIRFNPEVDPETHPGIATSLKDAKFGLEKTAILQVVNALTTHPHVKLKSLSFHLGSQIMNLDVYRKAIHILKPFYLELKKKCPELCRLDLGGGLGINYRNHDLSQDEQRWDELIKIYDSELNDFNDELILEPGRFLVARAGVLLSRVEIIKKTPHKNFLILDAGMSLLMRPALYQAYHDIKPVIRLEKKLAIAADMSAEGNDCVNSQVGGFETYDVVGPICESSDVFHKEMNMPKLFEGDFVAICDVGAYGAAMSSRYNLREEAAEIFI